MWIANDHMVDLIQTTITYHRILTDLKSVNNHNVVGFAHMLLAHEDHTIEATFQEHELTLLAFGIIEHGKATEQID